MEEDSPASTVDLSHLHAHYLRHVPIHTWTNTCTSHRDTPEGKKNTQTTDKQRDTHTHTLATWNLHISSCHVDCSAVCCHGTLFLHVVLKHCLAAYSSNLQGLSSHFLEHRDVAMKFIILYLSENSSFFLHFSKDFVGSGKILSRFYCFHQFVDASLLPFDFCIYGKRSLRVAEEMAKGWGPLIAEGQGSIPTMHRVAHSCLHFQLQRDPVPLASQSPSTHVHISTTDTQAYTWF